MGNKPKLFPAIIETEPEGIDQFEGGSQIRVATTIRECIEQRRFKLMGIDGKWGAGKSNVIILVKKSLDKSYHFFIYDAWAHQEELQRRSFLEELNDELIEAKWLSETKWREKLKFLFSKTKHLHVRDIPKLSYLLIFTLFLSALTPIVKQFLDVYITEEKLRGFLLAFFPVVLGIIVYVAYLFKEKKKFRFSEAAALVKEKETDKYTEERVSEYETSVRDFRNWMKDLSKEIEGKHLVIVFDNMDRLPADKVISLWSNMHTFFSGAAYKNITLLVPFDRTHIGAAFGDNEENKKGTADYFINKTFPVVFAISDVPLAGWKKFFAQKCKEAFGEDVKEVDEMTNIFDRDHNRITPREIIAFINTIVSLKLIWKEEIEMRYLALFAATRKDHFGSGRAEILQGNYATSADVVFRGDDKLPGIMSALYYNISPEIASEITLYRDIEVSAREKDFVRLSLLSAHPDFFIIADNVATTGGSPLENFVYAFYLLEELKQNAEFSSRLKTIWNHLIGRRMSIQEMDEKKFTEMDQTLIRKAKGGPRLDKLISCICSSIGKVRNFSGAAYGEALMAMEDFLLKNKIPADLSKLIPLMNMPGDQYLHFVRQTEDKFNKYNVIVDEADLESRILEKFPVNMGEVPTGDYLKSFRFKNLLSRIQEHVISNQMEATMVEAIYAVYKVIGKAPLAMPTEPTVQQMLGVTDTSRGPYNELAAMKFAYAARSLKDSNTGTALFNRSDNDFIMQLSSRILFYCNADDLLATTAEFESEPFSLLAKDVILKNRTGSGRFIYQKVFAKYFVIREAIGLSDKEMMDYLSFYSKSLPDEIKLSGIGVVLADEQIIPVVMQSEGPLKQMIIDAIGEYVSHIDATTWVMRFNNLNSFDGKLLLTSLRIGAVEQMPAAASEGLKTILPGLMDQNPDELMPHAGSYELLFSHADKSVLAETIVALRDKLIDNYNGNLNLFLFAEPILKQYDQFEERLDEFMEKIFIPSAGDRRLLDVLVKDPTYYEGFCAHSEKYAVEIISAIRGFIESNEQDENAEAYRRFVNAVSYISYGPIKIFTGEYISTNDFMARSDVTDKLIQWVEEEHQYFFKLHNGIADNNDPEFGFVKELQMKYAYHDEEINLKCMENQWVKLP
jgi:cbb3-type cytochrome oxidase subunit 3